MITEHLTPDEADTCDIRITIPANAPPGMFMVSVPSLRGVPLGAPITAAQSLAAHLADFIGEHNHGTEVTSTVADIINGKAPS